MITPPIYIWGTNVYIDRVYTDRHSLDASKDARDLSLALDAYSYDQPVYRKTEWYKH